MGDGIQERARYWLGQLNGLAYEMAFHLWERTAGRNARLERPIFIIGCPRSGTTVATELFARHPDVVSLSEAQEVWDPEHHLDPEADHHWTAERVTSEEARRLHARFEFHRRLHRARRLLNKNPRSSVRLDYIRAVFPDACFLHVIRDGRAVVHSLLEETRKHPQRGQFPFGNFCKPPNWRELLRYPALEQAAWQWKEIVSHVLTRRQDLGASYHEFHYEDLCVDPRGVLREAYAFAGLRVDRDALGRLPEGLDSRNLKWKMALGSGDIEAVNRIQAPLLQQLGYPL